MENFDDNRSVNFEFRFKKWDIYEDALVLRKFITEIIKQLPKEEKILSR